MTFRKRDGKGGMMKIGFLFGAGAELGYGMPSGGSFALDIFRQDSTLAKNKFKEMRDAVDDDIKYASVWLPYEYRTKNISSFGKTVFEAIIKDTIEHNRNKIIAKLNDFDSMASSIVDRLKKTEDIDVDGAFSELGVDVRNISMLQKVSC